MNGGAGFLCNVREPYDPETLMPVHFNATCNVEGAYDPRTSLAIDPLVDRPVDRARELYLRALEVYQHASMAASVYGSAGIRVF